MPLLSAVLAAMLATSPATASCGNDGMKADAMADCTNVATARKPATYKLARSAEGLATTSPAALEVTARPVGADAASPYLVQVYAGWSDEAGTGPATLLGTFSFLPARIGKAQTFILPKPDMAGASSADGLTLSIRLVAANASRTLKDTAVEILDARLTP